MFKNHVYGIDLGSNMIKIYSQNSNEILKEKNMIAIRNKDTVLAVGDEAYEMYEKAPEHIEVSFPVKFGVIADIENMQTLLFNFFNKINEGKKITGSDFYIAVPTDVTEVEKRAFYELVVDSKVKAKNVYVVDKPVADAIGAGLDVTKSKGIMIVNIGAETTEISVLSLGGIVISKAVKIGGNKLDDCIISNVRTDTTERSFYHLLQLTLIFLRKILRIRVQREKHIIDTLSDRLIRINRIDIKHIQFFHNRIKYIQILGDLEIAVVPTLETKESYDSRNRYPNNSYPPIQQFFHTSFHINES